MSANKRRFVSQREFRGKLTAPQIRLVIALPFGRPTSKHLGKLARIVGGICLVRQNKMRFNKVTHILQHHGSALLNIVDCRNAGISDRTIHQFPCLFGRNFRLHFIAPNICKSNGFSDGNSIDNPLYARMPQNRFQDTASRRGRHTVVTDTFRF